MADPDNTQQEFPFWRFSVGFYSVPEVADACLDLQDTSGADVNILMFLLWNARQKRKFSAAAVAELDRRFAPWRDTAVVPLRTLRRALKSPPAAIEPAKAERFRTRIKGVELEAERLQQEALYEIAPRLALEPASSPAEAARASIAAYATLCPKPFPAKTVDVLLSAFAKAGAVSA
jgi:uncharacterized protein (TIGR02444 family)